MLSKVVRWFSGLYFLGQVVCIPSLHKVNDVDLRGQTCPLQTLFHQVCLPLCVKSLAQCPPATLVCPAGHQLCQDGECHTSCQGIKNICGCDQASYEYVPCGNNLFATVKDLVPDNRTSMLAASCSLAIGLKEGDYELWTATPKASFVWVSCPEVPSPSFTFKEPMYIGFYSLVFGQFILFVVWHLFKSYKEKEVPRSAKPTSKTSTHQVEFRYQGYYSNPFGTFMFINTHLITFIWLSLLGLIVADNYGAIGSKFYSVFLSSELVSKIFVVVWHLSGLWLAILFVCRDRLRNYFRLRCDMKLAQVVQIEKYPAQVILSASLTPLFLSFKRVFDQLTHLLGAQLQVQTVPIHTLPSGLQYFEFQCVRYIKTPSETQFSPAVSDLPTSASELIKLSGGLDNNQVLYLRERFGANLIQVKVSTFFSALLSEFISFPYLYQMMFLWVWYFFTYYQMALVQTVVIMFSALVQVVIRIRSETQIQGLASMSANFSVLRDGGWITLPSGELVPGDVFQVRSETPVPCDAVLLTGEAIVDESMLTGEAMPIRKLPLKDDQANYSPTAGSGSSLISGTAVLQVTPRSNSEAFKVSNLDGKVVALATATAINTDKGSLIRRILFPSEYSFVFTEHLKVVILILLSWGMVCFGLSMYFMGRGDVNSWFYGMFVISQILSPLLPSALVVGQSVAATRLRQRHKISCVDLPRIMVAGKVKTFCFDKTGTLTKPGLNFHGLLCTVDSGSSDPSDSNRVIFDAMIRSTENLNRTQQLAMATCHAVSKLDGKLFGNPVDVEQFSVSNWNFLPELVSSAYEGAVVPTQSHTQSPVYLVKRNGFIHARSSMSVIVEDPTTKHWHVFIKGSFEKIKCLVAQHSVPFNFDQVTKHLTREGGYVLGFAHRDLGIPSLQEREGIRGWSRDEVESDAQFLGLLVFRNQLKEDTALAISDLHDGDTRTVMVTGDNALTGVCIARACGMISSGAQVVLGDIGQGDSASTLFWQDVDLDTQIPFKDLELLLSRSPHPIELAVTGKAFDHLVKNNKLRSLNDHIRVYARMTPEHKVACVEYLMETSVVGMCGDGGNDCGALRAAHIGVALSDAEASIVSPFSSSFHSIQSCVSILRYGRAALASSFACYKFLILYGEIMAWLELTQFYFSVVVSQPIWITVDGFITVFMMITLALANPSKTLSNVRPTAKLLGPQTLASAISQSLVNLAFLSGAIGLLFSQSFFKCNEFDGAAVDSAKWWLMGDNFEAEVIGLVCLAQFINAAGVFNFGFLFRASWWRNFPLVFIYFGSLIFVGFLLLANPNPLGCIFRINCGSSLALTDILHYPSPNFSITDYNNPIGHNVMPLHFRLKLFALITANCLVNLAIEYFLILHGSIPAFVKKLTSSFFVNKDAKNMPEKC